MKKKLIEIFEKYNYPYFCFDLHQSIKDLIIKVENDLINKSYSIEMCRSLIVDLWQFEKDLEREKLESTQEFKTILADILSDDRYKEDGKFIVFTKNIDCCAIKTKFGFYILNDKQIKKVKDLGYGIENFKLEKSKTITNIVCSGIHPNIDKFSGSFCLGSSLSNLELNKSNLDLMEQSFGQFNLVSVFLEPHELATLIGVVE